MKTEQDEELLKREFVFVTARDIVMVARKYYPNATATDRKSGPMLKATYLYLLKNHVLGAERDYTNQDLAIQLGMKHNQSIAYYRKKHLKEMERSLRYKKRLLAMISDLAEIESKMEREYDKKINSTP